MLTDMILAYVNATTKKEKERAERDCRSLGIDKRTLLIMAAQVAEDMGVTPCHRKEKG